MNFKRRIFDIIQPDSADSVASRAFDLVITALILASVVIVFAVTFDLPQGVMNALILVEKVASVVFTLVGSFFFVGLLMLVSSLLMYSVEHDAQPDVFCNAFSGLWWAVATLTTVGYGDIYPVTVFGRVLGAVIAFSGIAALAIPTGIVTAGLTERIGRNDALEKELEKQRSKDAEHDNELSRQREKDDDHDRLLREQGVMLKEISEKLSKLEK